MKQHPVFETERTYLRQLCPGDFNEMCAILGDIDVMYAWEHGFSDEEVRDWIGENIKRYARDGYSYWAVVFKETGSIIGVAGLLAEEAEGEAYTGVGYILHKDFWHQGFATECADACKRYAFETLGLPLLTAQIRPENLASIRVAERLGMTPVKQVVRIYWGKSMPHILYGIENPSA